MRTNVVNIFAMITKQEFTKWAVDEWVRYENDILQISYFHRLL